MERTLFCLRCQSEMNHIMDEEIQLGRTGVLFGHWSNLIAGSLEVCVYGCPTCGKLEFFHPLISDQ